MAFKCIKTRPSAYTHFKFMLFCPIFVYVFNCLYNIPVKASGEYYYAWRFWGGWVGGGAIRIAWFVSGQHSTALRCNMRVWSCYKFFLSENLQHLSKPQSLQLSNHHIISQTKPCVPSVHMAECKKPADEVNESKGNKKSWTYQYTKNKKGGGKKTGNLWIGGMIRHKTSPWNPIQPLSMYSEKCLHLTFEGYEDSGCSQNVIAHWGPESEAGQCQEGVDRPQTVQLHGQPTSSSTETVIKQKRNHCRDKRGQTWRQWVETLWTPHSKSLSENATF